MTLRAYLAELEAWHGARLDADTPWKIDEKGAPSPRAYLRIVRRWWGRWSAWVWTTLERDRLAIEVLRDLSTGGPPPPTPTQIADANKPSADRAIRNSRRDLIRAGMPDRVLARRLGFAPPGRPPGGGATPPAPMPGGVGVDLLGVDLVRGGVEQAALDAWAAEGVAYIRAVPAERLQGLAQRIAQTAARGERWETLRDDVRAQLGIGERHLELIARDQVAKLNGRITQAMQTAAGVTSYRWRAARDSRVRATHRAVDGQVFTWASGGPPGVGFYGTRAHPGQAGQCRCTAEPIIEEDW